MKYILMMVVDEKGWQNLTPEQMQPMMDAVDAYNKQLRDAGKWVGGEGYGFSWDAKTVRVNDGQRTVVDGPAMESKQQVGGHRVIEADSIEDAVDWARKVPMQNGSVEVRPLVPEDAIPSS